MTSKIINCCSL